MRRWQMSSLPASRGQRANPPLGLMRESQIPIAYVPLLERLGPRPLTLEPSRERFIMVVSHGHSSYAQQYTHCVSASCFPSKLISKMSPT